MLKKLKLGVTADITVCGAPMGGIAFGTILALEGGWRFIYPEKKVLTAATAETREKTEFMFNRHRISPGEKLLIVDDVSNNFSTTGKLISLINHWGGNVLGVACLLNRSLTVESEFTYSAKTYAVTALVRQPISEYSQDDAVVAADVQTGNVVWKPKDQWSKLTPSQT